MAENMEKIDLKNVDLTTFDFRDVFVEERLADVETKIHDYKGPSDMLTSLNKQKKDLKEWKNKENKDVWKSLYRMLWFHVNFPKSTPQVETHPAAFTVYTELYKDGNDQPIYIYEHEKKCFTIKENSKNSISADVMNGWWGPVKLFLGLSEFKGRKEFLSDNWKCLADQSEWKKRPKKEDDTSFKREKAISALKRWLENNNSQNDGEQLKKTLCDKLCDKNSDTEKIAAINAMLKFLNVVYTIGNFSPIPTGGCQGGGGLDNWAYKLYTKLYGAPKWESFIEKQCGENSQRERFLESHKFKEYINPDFKMPTAYWKITENVKKNPQDVEKDPQDFSKPNNSTEWKTYFVKTTELITNRSKALLSGNEGKIKGILIKHYPNLFEASSGNT